jgi:ribosomal protein L7/L12
MDPKQEANSPFPPDAAAALVRGDKIAAIKVVRERYGLGLKEAKDAVDRYVAAHPELRTAMEESAGVRNRGCLLAVVVAVLAAIGVYVLLRGR